MVAFDVAVNGVRRQIEAVPLRALLDVLREDLGLTGAKRGCDGGECGACTVLVDGAPVPSCLVPIVNVGSAAVTTVEGVRDDPRARRLAATLAECHGVQCGYCTPGFMMTILGGPFAGTVTQEEARELLAGNVCRCTGYYQIVEAACRFAEQYEGCDQAPPEVGADG